MDKFQEEILAGIPQDRLPEPKPYDKTINHAPKRKDILTAEEKVLALKNALRYFPAKFHAELAPESARPTTCTPDRSMNILAGAARPRPSWR